MFHLFEILNQYLITFCFPSCSHLFTADPRGTLKLWKIKDALLSDAHDTTADPKVFLIAAYTSCFGARIMCINASVEEEVILCVICVYKSNKQ